MKPENSWIEEKNLSLKSISLEANIKESSSKEESVYKQQSWKHLLNLAVENFFMIDSVALPEFIENLEKRIIIRALHNVNGSQKQAAKLLGMKYTTFHEKLKRYDIHFKKIPQ